MKKREHQETAELLRIISNLHHRRLGNRHKAKDTLQSQRQEVNKRIQLESASCCDCSTIELSTDQDTEHQPIVYLYKVQLTFCSFTLVAVPPVHIKAHAQPCSEGGKVFAMFMLPTVVVMLILYMLHSPWLCV